MLHGQYLQRGRQVQAFLDTTRRLEVALEWLEQYRAVEAIRERLPLWVVHICQQQSRIDVLQSVKAEIREESREEALTGTVPFCLEWFEQIMTDGVYCMSGNRCDFKVVSHLGHFLFDFEDGRIRKHWDERPYRTLYRTALTAVAFLGRDLKFTFRQHFWKTLYQYHWIMPYPCANTLMQTTKQGQRMWYSIRAREGVDAQTAEDKDWGWPQKDWQPVHRECSRDGWNGRKRTGRAGSGRVLDSRHLHRLCVRVESQVQYCYQRAPADCIDRCRVMLLRKSKWVQNSRSRLGRFGLPRSRLSSRRTFVVASKPFRHARAAIVQSISTSNSWPTSRTPRRSVDGLRSTPLPRRRLLRMWSGGESGGAVKPMRDASVYTHNTTQQGRPPLRSPFRRSRIGMEK